MSEERSQIPSRRRLQQAREQGQVARSPELTAAAGLLAAVLLLGAWGPDLLSGLVALVRAPLSGTPILAADAGLAVASLRQAAADLSAPLLAILSGTVASIIIAHQIQVRGLWVPGLLAPDATRLLPGAPGSGLGQRLTRGALALARAAIVIAVATWAIRTNLPLLARLGSLEPPALAATAGRLISNFALAVALTTLALGLADFVIQYRRFEALLHPTQQQQREDARSEDGDPAVRARRRQVAQAWRSNPAEILPGAAVVLAGHAGLTIVLAGGPPPRRVTIRAALHGAQGFRLRQAAQHARLPVLAEPDLAKQIASHRGPATALTPHTLAELRELWPSAS